MKPEIILQSNLLEILFEGRNKEYGAYALRKNYNLRLLQSLGVTCAIVSVFVLMQHIGLGKSQSSGIDTSNDSVALISVVIPPEEKTPAEKKQVALPKPAQPVQTETYTPPVIKPDIRETTVRDQHDLDSATIGSRATPGKPGDPQIFTVPGPGPATPAVTPPAEPVFDETTIRNYADIMPAFDGDIKKFMLKNLREPDDLEQGERVLVKVRFVVNKDGEIGNVEVVQSGRPDLDKEVMRVVRKMPRWRPGMQGGRAVPVYFNLPVTFVGNAE